MWIYLQVVVAILIIVLILLQERSSGLSGIFGGSENSGYQTRRGLEKIIFYSTIALTIIFIVLALFNLKG
jgi:protein translocase SecG subunit